MKWSVGVEAALLGEGGLEFLEGGGGEDEGVELLVVPEAGEVQSYGREGDML
jgi:hypothetical protein